ncbi:prepilin-type N-terminal cleavage/methylation domain-containing protein [Kiritimatiella glycovorans]|uniref:PilD-dependent protein PddA n=1 Tax=Kiritimatiella glycovorans TaxID=1307763 RepID=A0A0G3EK07_9BACT|nr:prepilin-type N-terminal cleavage/methylation domain-containing protein [Kiritimatiella glycovorans]AKJ65125.1 PilD-dependent protein PddA [Kiritimatiella glycovorans]
MMEEQSKKRRDGFTLIELLTVIGIIAILMAIVVPGVSKVKENAQKAKARTEIKSIEMAVKAYESEYGKYPNQTGASDGTFSTDEQLVNILRADDDADLSEDNPRRIVFLEVGEKSLDDGDFVDPWGEEYQVAYDGNYDNEITAGPSVNLKGRSVAVWSSGPNQNDQGGGDNTDDLNSWD